MYCICTCVYIIYKSYTRAGKGAHRGRNKVKYILYIHVWHTYLHRCAHVHGSRYIKPHTRAHTEPQVLLHNPVIVCFEWSAVEHLDWLKGIILGSRALVHGPVTRRWKLPVGSVFVCLSWDKKESMDGCTAGVFFPGTTWLCLCGVRWLYVCVCLNKKRKVWECCGVWCLGVLEAACNWLSDFTHMHTSVCVCVSAASHLTLSQRQLKLLS